MAWREVPRLQVGQQLRWRNDALGKLRGLATVTRIPPVDIDGKAVAVITYPSNGDEEVVWYRHRLLACTDPA